MQITVFPFLIGLQIFSLGMDLVLLAFAAWISLAFVGIKYATSPVSTEVAGGFPLLGSRVEWSNWIIGFKSGRQTQPAVDISGQTLWERHKLQCVYAAIAAATASPFVSVAAVVVANLVAAVVWFAASDRWRPGATVVVAGLFVAAATYYDIRMLAIAPSVTLFAREEIK